jgi:hypothetical protein
VVYLIVALLGVVLFYFWIKGHWFASVLATPFGVFLALLICDGAPVHEPYAGHIQLVIFVGSIALAWLPFGLRRFAQEQRVLHATAVIPIVPVIPRVRIEPHF